MRTIKFTIDCPECGEEFVAHSVLDLTQNEEDDVKINLSWIGDFTTNPCPCCGKTFYVPGLGEYIEESEEF